VKTASAALRKVGGGRGEGEAARKEEEEGGGGKNRPGKNGACIRDGLDGLPHPGSLSWPVRRLFHIRAEGWGGGGMEVGWRPLAALGDGDHVGSSVREVRRGCHRRGCWRILPTYRGWALLLKLRIIALPFLRDFIRFGLLLWEFYARERKREPRYCITVNLYKWHLLDIV
jgi:hypothetical protein